MSKITVGWFSVDLNLYCFSMKRNQNLSFVWRVNSSFVWQVQLKIAPDSVKQTGPALDKCLLFRLTALLLALSLRTVSLQLDL